MPQPSIPAPHSPRRPDLVHRFPRAAAAMGLLAGLAGGAALHAGAGHLQGFVFDHAWRAAAAQSNTALAFGGAQMPGAILSPTAVLHGINGEVFASTGTQAAAKHTAPGTAEAGPLANVSPAAWNRLSAGDCITVTTKGGQTLSFRIVGARPASEPKAETLPKIDLAVTACSGTGEPIAKAVIEPARQPLAQHSL